MPSGDVDAITDSGYSLPKGWTEDYDEEREARCFYDEYNGKKVWTIEQVFKDENREIPSGLLTPSKESKAAIEKDEPSKADLPNVDSLKGEKVQLAVRNKDPQTQPAGKAQKKQQAPQADTMAPGRQGDPAEPAHRLVAIAVSVGDHIDQLVFYFSDGSSKKYGSDGGQRRSTLVLADGEYLVAIKGTASDKNLKSVIFETSKSRKSQTALGDVPDVKAKLFEHRAANNNQIISVVRRKGFCGPIQSVGEVMIPPVPPSSEVVRLRAIIVKYYEFIDQITFWYSDGSKKDHGIKPTQWSYDDALVLGDDESLTELTSRSNANLEGITFKTNKQVFAIDGTRMRASAKKKTFEAKKGYQIWALERMQGFCGVIEKVEERRIDSHPAARASESQPRPLPALADAASSNTPTARSTPAPATSASKAPEPEPKAKFGANDAASPPRPSEAKTPESRTSTMVDTPQVKLAKATEDCSPPRLTATGTAPSAAAAPPSLAPKARPLRKAGPSVGAADFDDASRPECSVQTELRVQDLWEKVHSLEEELSVALQRVSEVRQREGYLERRLREETMAAQAAIRERTEFEETLEHTRKVHVQQVRKLQVAEANSSLQSLQRILARGNGSSEREAQLQSEVRDYQEELRQRSLASSRHAARLESETEVRLRTEIQELREERDAALRKSLESRLQVVTDASGELQQECEQMGSALSEKQEEVLTMEIDACNQEASLVLQRDKIIRRAEHLTDVSNIGLQQQASQPQPAGAKKPGASPRQTGQQPRQSDLKSFRSPDAARSVEVIDRIHMESDLLNETVEGFNDLCDKPTAQFSQGAALCIPRS